MSKPKKHVPMGAPLAVVVIVFLIGTVACGELPFAWLFD